MVVVAPSPAFFDTSVLLGGLADPSSAPPPETVSSVDGFTTPTSGRSSVARVSVVVTDNVRHFADLRRHGVEVMNATQFAETITAA